jgi:hypothetical protein
MNFLLSPISVKKQVRIIIRLLPKRIPVKGAQFPNRTDVVFISAILAACQVRIWPDFWSPISGSKGRGQVSIIGLGPGYDSQIQISIISTMITESVTGKYNN